MQCARSFRVCIDSGQARRYTMSGLNSAAHFWLRMRRYASLIIIKKLDNLLKWPKNLQRWSYFYLSIEQKSFTVYLTSKITAILHYFVTSIFFTGAEFLKQSACQVVWLYNDASTLIRSGREEIALARMPRVSRWIIAPLSAR